MGAHLKEIPAKWGLVADIGGTNCRFAVVDLERPYHKPAAKQVFKCADYDHVTDAAKIYMQNNGLETKPDFAVFAVAGPVTDNSIQFTNSNWQFSGQEVKDRLGAKEVTLLNDFTALALSLPFMDCEDLELVGPNVEGVSGGTGMSVSAILGPGTGLGVSALIESAGQFIPLDTEGGHTSYAPLEAEEKEIAAFLSKQYGRLSNERILSGGGLKDLYTGMAAVRGIETRIKLPSDVSDRAFEHNEDLAKDCLNLFYSILGSVAGDVALTTGAQKGVYIGGGIAPRMTDFVKNSPFRSRFEDKGRFNSYMAAIPTFIVTHGCPALIGCSAYMRHNHLNLPKLAPANMDRKAS